MVVSLTHYVFPLETALSSDTFSSEGDGMPQRIPPEVTQIGSASPQNYPDFLDFTAKLYYYNDLALTYHCDSLNAFSGVLGFHQHTFGSFHYGLSELAFDLALLWQPKSELEDRKVLARDDSQQVSPLPSWSWARWKGQINFAAFDATITPLNWTDTRLRSMFHCDSLVQWSKMKDGGRKRFRIRNDYFSYTNVILNAPVPAGWLREPGIKGHFKHALTGDKRFE
jgi:hypothetical protein